MSRTQAQPSSFALQIFPVKLIKKQSRILGSQYCIQKLFPVLIHLPFLPPPPLFGRFIPGSGQELGAIPELSWNYNSHPFYFMDLL